MSKVAKCAKFTLSRKAKLHLPVAHFHRYMKKLSHLRLSKASSVQIVAAVEYLLTEIIEAMQVQIQYEPSSLFTAS